MCRNKDICLTDRGIIWTPAFGGMPASGIDTRLIAAVQGRAGAKVHEAAGLIQQYYLWANLLTRAKRAHDNPMTETASANVNAAKVRLRQFLTASAVAVARN